MSWGVARKVLVGSLALTFACSNEPDVAGPHPAGGGIAGKYVVPTGRQRIDALDLGSGAIETVASTEGGITGLTVDESHAYWVDHVDQWNCVKRLPLR